MILDTGLITHNSSEYSYNLYEGFTAKHLCRMDITDDLICQLDLTSPSSLKDWFERVYRGCKFLRVAFRNGHTQTSTIEFYASEEVYRMLLKCKDPFSMGCKTYGHDTPITLMDNKKDIPQKVVNKKEEVLCSRHLWG